MSIGCTFAKLQAETFLCGLWNQFHGVRCTFLITLVAILRWSEVILQSHGQKGFFAGFESGFIAFSTLFWALWWLFCVDGTYRCVYTDKNVSSRVFKLVLPHSLFFFEHFGQYFASIESTVANTRAETTFFRGHLNWFFCIRRFFVHSHCYIALIGRTFVKIRVERFLCWFWNWFLSICRSFLSTLLRSYFVSIGKYRCQNTRGNFSSRALKQVLQHLPLFFEHFYGYFLSIGRTVAKIRAETFFCEFWNRFYDISRTYLSTLVAHLRRSDVPLPRYGWKGFLAGFENWFCGIRR